VFNPFVLHGEENGSHLFTSSVRGSFKYLQVKISILDCLDYPGFDPTRAHAVFVAAFHRLERLQWAIGGLAVRGTQFRFRVDRDFIRLALKTSQTVAGNESLHQYKLIICSNLVGDRMSKHNRQVASYI
jgi:hypothetical protein